MNNWRAACLIGLTLVLLPGLARTGLAAASLTLAPSSPGTFVLQGFGLENVGAMDITIGYDSATLANPRIVPGELIAGALLATNTGHPGEVRLGVVRTTAIQGSGTVATLSFDVQGNAPGKINGLSAGLVSLDGSTLPVQVRVVQPADPGPAAPTTDTPASGQPVGDQGVPAGDTAGTSSGSPGGASQMLTAGSLTGLPGTERGGDAAVPETAPQQSFAPAGEPPSVTRSDDRDVRIEGNVSERDVISLESVLGRFRNFAGEATAAGFMKLFDPVGTGGFRQDPSPCLTDGRATLEVEVTGGTVGNQAPNVAVQGARLLSLAQDPADASAWIVKLQPEGNGLEASLAVSTDQVATIFPLVLAPRVNIDLNRSGSVTAEDFSLFLKNREGFDLSGDGKRDYRDDYIFTANYLAAQQAVKKAPEKNP